jgi:hypothetical protein
MARQHIEDGTWFDDATATEFNEDTYWDGNNHCSCATGSQWEHQSLYRTRSGGWVLMSSSQWQGARTTYHLIPRDEARKWLISQDKSDEVIEKYFPGELEKSEI